MKKIIWILSFIGILTVVVFNGEKVIADEMEDFLSKYALTGEDLDKFEENELRQNQQRSSKSFDLETLRDQYEQYRELGIFDEEVTFEIYVQLATTPPPTDTVAPEFRSVAGNPQAGDILITNGTSLGGLTGHAGIFLGTLGNGGILSIQGPGYKPEVIGIFEWMRRYSGTNRWTKLYRPTSQYRPTDAARWAKNNYEFKNYSYGINMKIFEKDPTYCSKIVWQAYWYSSAAAQVGGMYQPFIASPYDLPNYFDKRPTHVATWQ